MNAWAPLRIAAYPKSKPVADVPTPAERHHFLAGRQGRGDNQPPQQCLVALVRMNRILSEEKSSILSGDQILLPRSLCCLGPRQKGQVLPFRQLVRRCDFEAGC